MHVNVGMHKDRNIRERIVALVYVPCEYSRLSRLARSRILAGQRAVKGGGISEKATKITFAVNSAEDMNRDIFKSDSCLSISI